MHRLMSVRNVAATIVLILIVGCGGGTEVVATPDSPAVSANILIRLVERLRVGPVQVAGMGRGTERCGEEGACGHLPHERGTTRGGEAGSAAVGPVPFDDAAFRGGRVRFAYPTGRSLARQGSARTAVPGRGVVGEPTMRLAGVGSINIEDTTVVTEDGCEVLTSTPREWDAFL